MFIPRSTEKSAEIARYTCIIQACSKAPERTAQMTYAEAWKIYLSAKTPEDWATPEFEAAAEHIRLADYDLQTGFISDVTEYDA